MAVTSCRLINRSAEFNLRNQNSQEVEYVINCDSRMSADAVYLGALATGPHPIPERYTYVGMSTYVLSIRLRQQTGKSYKRWIATLICGQLPQGEDPADGGGEALDNPLKRKVVFWLERTSESKIIEKDRNGAEIKNTAGQPFDEPPTRERHIPIFAFRRNFPSYQDIFDLNDCFENATNNDTFAGRSKEKLIYLPAECSERQFENNVEFYTAEFRMQYHPAGTQLSLLQRGWKHFTAPGGALVAARDDEKQLVSEPILLALDGTALPKGAVGVFKNYDVLPLRNFATLIDLSKTAAQIITAAKAGVP